MRNLKVTIIMATFNRAVFIEETLQSIISQSYTNWECIIIDDGGTDNTLEVIQPILNDDARFKYLIRNEKYKKGLPGCRNQGLDMATGDCIVFFDDDDLVHPENLKICVSELTPSDVHFCRYLRTVFTGDFSYDYDARSSYTKFAITVDDIERIINNRLPFNSCAVVWKKECFDKNRFNETLMFAEEWELYTRIIASGKFTGVSIDKYLFYGRKHEKSNTGEFNQNNPIRRKSKADAVLLILNSLTENAILTRSITRYFIQISLDFKEFNLFQSILVGLKIKGGEKRRWQFFYFVLPMKLQLYKLKKRWLRKY